MPYCPQCKAEKDTASMFCPECGAKLEATPPPPTPAVSHSRTVTAVDTERIDTLIAGSEAPADGVHHGECTICGRYVRATDTFRCRTCGRSFVCVDHLDRELWMCCDCAGQVRRERQAQREAEERASWPNWRKIGIEMVTVPAGEFLYGEDKQRVCLPEYRLARTLVTNAQYKEFVDATGRAAPLHWEEGRIPAGKDDHPVVCVSWNNAQAFCDWAGCRLPTEREWEKGARGADGREYPWGDTWEENRCNSWQSEIRATTPVGRYPQGASPYGLLDMAGNAWEWCQDWYDAGRNVLRGGSWLEGPRWVRAAFRGMNDPARWDFFIGFRCACTTAP